MALTAPPSDAALFRERGITLPSFQNYKPSKELKGGHRLSVRGVAWSIDGRKLASCGADRSVRVWTPERSVDVRASTELRGHTESVDQLAWSPTAPDQIATASADKSVRIWDIRSAKATQVISTPGSNINIAYHPHGHQVAVGDKADTISIIDVKMGRIVETVQDRSRGPVEEINEFTWSPDGSLFLLTSGTGSIHIHDARNPLEGDANTAKGAATRWSRLHTMVAHTANVFCIEMDPSSRYMATASADSMIGLWALDEWMSVRMSGSLSFPARSLSFSHDGEFLAAGGEDPWIDISSVATGNTVYKLPVTGMINTLAWHPSKLYLAYAGDEPPSTTASGGGGSAASSAAKDNGVIRIFGL
ncbi:uncharacterized protein PFL1_03907 [Pseudozyma flocculosa PF-1]|uniref:Related to THO complex subunit 3 n=2 Tax=Pseudozyma flocculosa TaxID=84751 RepID=A0A5C3EY31_9BASI|nr:uncharacterized protein PFL1_03907 [Pseudozyma flocculosa PF-1]EPQ28604.1 hypothetical protein PFL1_03907 [Pseudozyma flocculosa PF-1]SPO36546.1 related to THO complex subunit 3 [Pseudozyma flocculosa]